MARIANLESVFRFLATVALFFYMLAVYWIGELGKPILKSIFPEIYQKKEGVVYFASRLFMQSSLTTLGIRIVTTYKQVPDPKKAYLVMFTHGSNLDPPCIFSTMPQQAHFVAKKSLFKVPIWSHAMKISGAIPIDRENLGSAIESLQFARETIVKEAKTVAIAPEGTRRRSNSTGDVSQLLPFKKGPFHLAKGAGHEILPIVFVGTHRLWPPGQIFPTQGTIYMKYCEPIPASVVEKSSLEELQALVKESFDKNMESIDDADVFANPSKNTWLPYFLIGIFIVNLKLIKMLFF